MHVMSRLLTAVAAAGLLTVAGTGAASAAPAPQQAPVQAQAASCGLSYWDQSYTNCRNYNASVDIIYVWGAGPGGTPTYSTVNWCIPAHQTKNIAQPGTGMAQQAVEVGRC